MKDCRSCNPLLPPVLTLIVVKSMMYGFGDELQPLPESVNVMEEMLIEYIANVVRGYTLHKSYHVSHLPVVFNSSDSRQKIKITD